MWQELTTSLQTKAGVIVSPENALNVASVYACIRVLSETVASLPLKLYKETPDGSVIATKHPLYSILHDSPNDFQTAYEFRETMIAHLNMRGNFYALKEFNRAGQLAGLVPLNPSKMEVKAANNALAYEYTQEGGAKIVYDAAQIWHVKALSTDGIVGLSPITVAREAIGLAKATEAHGARMFKNDARPGGVLTTPGQLTEQAIKRLKESWQAAQTGDNAWKVAVLENGMGWTSIGFNNDDAQFLETRNFQVEDIARIFRVPAVLIGHPDKTMTYASAEQFFLSFAMHTVRPWAVRIEQSINRHLLSENDRKTYFAEFTLDSLLRADTSSRYEAYASAIQNRWMSPNEVREKENLNKIKGGDVFENPNISIKKETKE